jgi:hypothetical protein
MKTQPTGRKMKLALVRIRVKLRDRPVPLWVHNRWRTEYPLCVTKSNAGLFPMSIVPHVLVGLQLPKNAEVTVVSNVF